MQGLPGFRDFLPNDCAARNYIFSKWREVARRYGFVEWEGPILESTELYRKKSGSEIVDQLFHFTDKGERDVALRPELTPTLARVVAAHEREFKKPLKWFSIGPFFRYEKQQRGRLREHFQLNCDVIGDDSMNADAEMMALVIDILRAFGFTADDFVVRISHRKAWTEFMKDKGFSLSDSQIREFFSVIDKWNFLHPPDKDPRLESIGISIEAVQNFIQMPGNYFQGFNSIIDNFTARGLRDYVRISPWIVRGLAYYTGFVFEVFDKGGKLRAIAGGGRYDNLIENLSDGAVKLPALGFAMGDVVLGELIRDRPVASEKLEAAVRAESKIHIYVVIAKEDEETRANALEDIQRLRDRGYRVDYPLKAIKVTKQFDTAKDLRATIAILYGDEWPQVKIKILATREETLVDHESLLDSVAKLVNVSAPV